MRQAISRREFLTGAAASALALGLPGCATWVPWIDRPLPPGERPHVACIGIGGQGWIDTMRISAAGAHIAALCDVEGDRPLGWFMRDVARRFPQARFYRDFRTLLEKEAAGLDAVVVSTPDHAHCAPAVMAMRMGKHVYCQKPLAHSIAEARLMAETARLHGVATQMGNQAHAGEVVRRGVELVRGGIIGRVREVHAWTNRPIWPQGMATRPADAPVPASLDWDLWLGPAPDRPYARGYCPFAWRGWWDFGTGALGDMACHILDMPYWALELDAPTRIEAASEGGTEESPEAVREIPVTLPRVPNDAIEWIDACRSGPPALSSFAVSGPFTEAVLTGNLALRLREAIDWDGPLMQARNAPQAEALIRRGYRPGWGL